MKVDLQSQQPPRTPAIIFYSSHHFLAAFTNASRHNRSRTSHHGSHGESERYSQGRTPLATIRRRPRGKTGRPSTRIVDHLHPTVLTEPASRPLLDLLPSPLWRPPCRKSSQDPFPGGFPREPRALWRIFLLQQRVDGPSREAQSHLTLHSSLSALKP